MKSTKEIPSRRSRKKGLPPGSLVHIGTTFPSKQGLTYHQYDAKSWTHVLGIPKENAKFADGKPPTTWLEINGLSDISVLNPVFEQMHVTSLILEDILNTDQNAKSDSGENWFFLELKNIQWNAKSFTWRSEQISLVLEPELTLSFAEQKSDLLNPAYALLEVAGSKIRTRGADFTFYTLLDIIVDNYLEIAENLEMQIEEMELSMEGRSNFDPTQNIHQIRKFQIFFRHQVMPVREGLLQLIKNPDEMISFDDLPYFHDILDHLNQIISKLDQIRDNLSSIRELYLTQLNIGLNKVIQLLTVVSTIFIPVTFIAGIYGMNFKYMPELYWKNGYYIVLGIMATIGIGTYLFFKSKKWM